MLLEQLSKFSLQNLKVFCYVAKMNSVVEAAKALHMSQPAVTQHVQALEQHLSVNLFQKSGRKNVLTAEGTRLLNNLLPKLEEFDVLLKNINDSKNFFSTLNVGSVQALAENFLFDKVSEFCATNKQFQFNFEIAETSELVEDVSNGKLCMAVVPESIKKNGFVCERLIDEDFVAVGDQESIAVFKEALACQDLDMIQNKLPWIVYGARQRHDTWLYGWLNAQGVKLAFNSIISASSANSYYLITKHLKKYGGLSICPRHAVGDAKNLVIYEGKSTVSNSLFVIYRANSLSDSHHELLSWLKGIC